MNILYFVNSFPDSESSSRSIFNLNAATQLSARAKIHVFTVRAWRPFKKLLNQYHYRGFLVTCLYLPVIPHNSQRIPFSDSVFIHRVSTRIATSFALLLLKRLGTRFDVIHSVSIGQNALVCHRLSVKYGVPHVTQAIGTDVNVHLPRLGRLPIYQAMFKNLRLVICNSEDLTLKTQQLIPNTTVVRIYRGVDLNVFHPGSAKTTRSASRAGKNISFLYLGGFYPTRIDRGGNKKGGITLLNAWKINEHRFEQLSARLFVGGPNATSQFLHELLKKLNLNLKLIELIGTKDHQEIPELMADADAVIIPSLEEGLPNVGMESLSSGTPVIGSNTGGIPELVHHGYSGFLCIPGDANDLSEKMIEFAKNRELAARMARNARVVAETRFDKKTYPDQIFDAYRVVGIDR